MCMYVSGSLALKIEAGSVSISKQPLPDDEVSTERRFSWLNCGPKNKVGKSEGSLRD